jgi:hypothetical protein
VSRGEGELLIVPKPRAVRLLSVCLAVKPVGKPDAGNRLVRFAAAVCCPLPHDSLKAAAKVQATQISHSMIRKALVVVGSGGISALLKLGSVCAEARTRTNRFVRA